MNKSKIGISIPLMLFIVLISGLLGNIFAIIVAGYVLIKEEDELLKRGAVLSLMIAIIACVISFMITFSNGAFQLLSMSSFYGLFIFPFIFKFISMFLTFILFVKNIFLIILAGLSLTERQIKFSILDKFYDKHIR